MAKTPIRISKGGCAGNECFRAMGFIMDFQYVIGILLDKALIAI
jgi:hypothetical protein